MISDGNEKELTPLQPYLASAIHQIRTDWNRKIAARLGSEDFGPPEAQAREDLCNILLQAKFAAYERYQSDSWRDEGRRIGYVCGYTQSALDAQWKGLYLLPQLREYQEIMWLVAILNYLRIDSKALSIVAKLHRYFYETGSGKYQLLESAFIGLTDDVDLTQDTFTAPTEDLAENLQQIEQIFTSTILTTIKKIKEFDEELWLRNMEQYFPRQAIEQFVLDV